MMMPFTKSVTRCQYERLTRWSSASSLVTSVILRARTLAQGGGPPLLYPSLAVEASAQPIHFPLEIIYLLIMRVMTGMMLISMFKMYKQSSFIVGVAHITVPSSFKIYKLVPPLGPNKLQGTTSSGVGHNKKAFTQGYLGDFPTDGANYGGKK